MFLFHNLIAKSYNILAVKEVTRAGTMADTEVIVHPHC